MTGAPDRRLSRLGRWLRRLSIRRKITAVILLAFMLTLPPVVLSLGYFARILEEIDVIIERDVTLGRQAADLSLGMYDIRHSERYFLVSGARAERDSLFSRLARTEGMLAVADRLAEGEARDHVRDMTAELAEYRSLVTALIERIDPAGGEASSTEGLDRASMAFIESAQLLAGHAWENMRAHRAESVLIEARAKRDIIMVMILTAIIYLYMLVSMPRRIIRPVTRLNALLKKTIAGDFREHAREYSNDEIGDLASNYNHVLDRIWQYDELKTRKIGSQKRMIDRMLEMLPAPVCLISANLVLLYYNPAFADLFGGRIPPKPPDIGVELTRIDGMNRLADDLHQIVSGTRTEFTLTVTDAEDSTHPFRGRLIRNPLMEQESMIIIGQPCTQPDGA